MDIIKESVIYGSGKGESMKINTVALIGLGAIGAYLGGPIGKYLGDDFRVIASGERAERLKSEGMIINGEQQFFNVVDPEEQTGPADLAIIITKMPGIEKALEEMKNQIGSDTVIMTPLNGVESEEAAAKVYGEERILHSLVRVSSVKDGNTVSYFPDTAFVEFGEKRSDTPTERMLAVGELFDGAGIKYVMQKDMVKAIWLKYVCNVSENPVAAVFDIPFGAWGANEHANFLRLKTADEVIKIARAMGIEIDEKYPVEHLERLKSQPYNNTCSMVQDIENGRHTEIDMFAGTIIKYGKKLGIPTPYNEFLYHAVHLIEDRNDGLF